MMFSQPFPALKLRFLWLAIGYALVTLVVYLSLTSSPPQGPDIPYQDKIFHTLAYFTLMAWFAQIYHDSFQRNMIAVVFIFMGFSMEYLQSFDPNRASEFADMVANTTGVLAGFLLTRTALKNVLVNFEKLIRL